MSSLPSLTIGSSGRCAFQATGCGRELGYSCFALAVSIDAFRRKLTVSSRWRSAVVSADGTTAARTTSRPTSASYARCKSKVQLVPKQDSEWHLLAVNLLLERDLIPESVSPKLKSLVTSKRREDIGMLLSVFSRICINNRRHDGVQVDRKKRLKDG